MKLTTIKLTKEELDTLYWEWEAKERIECDASLNPDSEYYDKKYFRNYFSILKKLQKSKREV